MWNLPGPEGTGALPPSYKSRNTCPGLYFSPGPTLSDLREGATSPPPPQGSNLSQPRLGGAVSNRIGWRLLLEDWLGSFFFPPCFKSDSNPQSYEIFQRGPPVIRKECAGRGYGKRMHLHPVCAQSSPALPVDRFYLDWSCVPLGASATPEDVC